MNSDEDFDLLSSSPIFLPQPKLKRLKKKAITVPELSPPKSVNFHVPTFNNSSQQLRSLNSDDPLEELTFGSVPNLGSLSALPKDHGSAASRVLDFDSVGYELDGNVIGSELEKDKVEGVADMKSHELERKRSSFDSSAEFKEKRRKKKRVDVDRAEKIARESVFNKRKAEKERRENLQQLRAESQRLLRETRDAAFKPITLVQKPISSILDKIRQRKLEILKKSSSNYVDSDTDDGSEYCLDDEMIDKVEEVELEVTPTCPEPTNIGFSTHLDGSKDAVDSVSCESIPSPMGAGSDLGDIFRAPIGDTQEIYSHSERSGVKDEAVNEKPNNLSNEVSEPSTFAMNLQLDSAPPDDDVSSDDEYYDKENVDPHLHGSVPLSSSPSGDPVKAFVDEEAEEEDDSDNDIHHFQDNEEGEDDDDMEDLKDLIATEFEEKATDREKRDQLHQQWLEQQDTAGMDNILQKLNHGSKLKESTSLEEEDEESKETESDNEFDDEAEDYIAPSDSVKINLKRVKQMIPQMFTDKDDAYVSSDDDETEMRLAKQCLFDKVEDKATFLSPSEDESSKEVFSRIKKLNIVQDTKRKGRTSSAIDMLHIGQNINISSKSSFVGRASNHFMPPTHKNGLSKVRSFIFERDDSNSRTSISLSDDSSDMIQKESQVPKTFSAKFQRNTQNKYSALISASQESTVSLLEILRKSSIHAKHSVQHAEAQQKESVFDAFKLAKKPTRTNAQV
ncbi:hypothetical protein TanjilG_09764 [Lupinus angustifolius]|uniref:DNA replication checkpoint mediator MRC1 domain-containing protein n=1 Tax=Lupinus angustifolius TaxID=3871 RepID=A0A4P1QWT5_LUPAN|nr:PREDICTED: uncharacterized protein LOC109328781 isoform X2 [Lupinus angustifolius]OIV96337.1 hypothetical protein TanjilG_09764 [Lupinus angustifolius]